MAKPTAMSSVCLSAVLLFSNGLAQNQAPVSLSPRLAALRAELEAGNRPALDAFWREIVARGAPLIEPIDGDKEHVLLTFLWRARGETRNVLLIGGPVGRWSPDRHLAQ